MGLFTPPEDLLIKAMSSMQTHVMLEHCVGSLDSVFKKALHKEPRLLAFLSKYEASYVKKGAIQLSYDYDVTIEYQQGCPASIHDVILDSESWDVAAMMKQGVVNDVTVVTKDTGGLSQKLSDNMEIMISGNEGVIGWNTATMSFESLSEYTACVISTSYIVPVPQLRQYQGKAIFAAKNIWKTILGRSKVPQFVKPFLALSYLTQECCYDQRAFAETAANPGAAPSDPVPHLAYGPLVEKRGICSGLAWAFKTLMDEANIECQCISGYVKEDMSVGHMWDLLKVDGQYYHVDPTWGIKQSGVHVSGLMQPDNIMKATHVWDASKYPVARGSRFDYDYVEDYLVENGNEYLDNGANETYFFPDEIVD